MKAVVNKYPHAANGARIKRYRLEQPRNRRYQDTVASACGMSRRHLIRLEKGESLPGVEIRDRLADYLGCDPAEIEAFDEDDAPFRSAAA